MVDDISQEGLRLVLRDEEVSFQAVKTWEVSTDPEFEAKKNRVLELYDIAERKATPGPGDPALAFSMAEFRPGRQWAAVTSRSRKATTAALRRGQVRATHERSNGVRHLLATLDMNRDRLYGHIRATKNRTNFVGLCRYRLSLYPPEVRIAIVMDNFSRTCRRGRPPGSGTGRLPTTSS